MNNKQDAPVQDVKLPRLEDVIEDIHKVLEATGISPADISVSQYSQSGGRYDGRMLRRMGGFRAIVDEAFRDQISKDFVTDRYLTNRRLYVNKLERRLGDREYLQNNLLQGLHRVYKEYGPMEVSGPLPDTTTEHVKTDRVNVAVISDIHLGLDIDIEEVITNKYNWKIGARRLGKYAEQVATYKQDHRDDCDHLRLILNGDLGQGMIHPDGNTDPIAYQCYGITKYLTAMIDYWRQYYRQIIVEFTPDNHMRMPRGSDRDYAEKVINNFSTFGVLLGLQNAFRHEPEVVFNTTKSPMSTFTIFGHKYVATHGDTCLSSGNVGSTIDVKKITNQILKLNASVLDGKHYNAVILGHVHVATLLYMNETNSYLCINGTGSGTDPYAQSQNFFRTKPSQILFEATKSHAVGDFRIVTLDDADDVPRYEQIVKPYNYSLHL